MIPHGVEVFVGLDPIDLRWGFERLSGVVTEKLGRSSVKPGSARRRCGLLPSAFMSQSWPLKSGGGNSEKTIRSPFGDQDSHEAEFSGPRFVSCRTSLPSGFIV